MNWQNMLVLSFWINCSVFLGAIVGQARPTAQITVLVRGDDGLAVTGIVICASTFQRQVSGDHFGRAESRIVEGSTDSKGTITLTIPCLSGEVTYGTHLPLVGYYWSKGDRICFTDTEAGKWKPWNPTVELLLKKIVNPIPMYAKKVGVHKKDGGQTALKTLEAAGYDLEKGDWVLPFGKGETSDFIFRLETEPKRTAQNKFKHDVELFDAKFTLSFSNVGDGIQAVTGSPSALRLSRVAPDRGYEPSLLRRNYRTKPDEPIHSEIKENRNYFFRIRTRMDEQGNIISALYGKIHGDIEWGHGGWVRFVYYLNPTSNDRNMEFDPTKNLFKKLTSLEEVHDP
jgi:hypothetical protein